MLMNDIFRSMTIALIDLIHIGLEKSCYHPNALGLTHAVIVYIHFIASVFIAHGFVIQTNYPALIFDPRVCGRGIRSTFNSSHSPVYKHRRANAGRD